MTAPVIDQTQPLDLRGVELSKDTHGRTVATCPGCKAWVLLDYYKGDRTVTRQVPHAHPCTHFETMLFNGELL
jgi:hypothetical protein